MKSVLILTASFGEGHNAAARNVREALAALSPGTQVVVSDVFHEACAWFNRLTKQSYLTMINHAPLLWQGLFVLLDRTPLLEMHIGLYRAALEQLRKQIETLRPSVVVSVYPGCNYLLDVLYGPGVRRPFRTVTIITDSLTINSVWYRAYSDSFIVANEATAEVLTEAAVPAKKIRIDGFPVPRIFTQLKANRPMQGDPWRVLYVINSGRHHAPEIVRRLLHLPDISLTVTVGRDEALGRHIRHLAASEGRHLAVKGWAPDMAHLMAESHVIVSKAGGATVQEALAARTPMIVTQIIPGQEEGNARLILENNAGEHAAEPGRIADTVSDVFARGGSRWREWLTAAQRLSRPDAADRIADYIISCHEAAT